MYKVKRNCGEDLGQIWAFCADQYYLMIVVVLPGGTKSNIIRNIFIWRVEYLIHNGILYSFVRSGMREISFFFTWKLSDLQIFVHWQWKKLSKLSSTEKRRYHSNCCLERDLKWKIVNRTWMVIYQYIYTVHFVHVTTSNITNHKQMF